MINLDIFHSLILEVQDDGIIMEQQRQIEKEVS